MPMFQRAGQFRLHRYLEQCHASDRCEFLDQRTMGRHLCNAVIGYARDLQSHDQETEAGLRSPCPIAVQIMTCQCSPGHVLLVEPTDA